MPGWETPHSAGSTSVEQAMQFRADSFKMPVTASFQIQPKPALGVA